MPWRVCKPDAAEPRDDTPDAVLADPAVPGDRQTCTISRAWDERLPCALAPGDVPIFPPRVSAIARPLVPGRVPRTSSCASPDTCEAGAKRWGLRVWHV